MIAGILTALWLLGLLAAAPALGHGARYSFADRLRDALILGAAIPFALGIVDLLYPAACWIVLAMCVAIAYRRASTVIEAPAQRSRPPYVLIAALALVAWPPLMRPLLDGDTLSYHLPNAAAWVHAHGLWTTDPRYWWYPPGSEIFASGLFAVSGPFGLGWSGFGALALIGFRVADWASAEFGLPAWLADALAAATVTMTPLALQAGSLQNDVWLAAFFLESLWVLQRQTGAAARTVAFTALLKPYGWIFAAVAAAASRAPLRVWIAAAAAIGVWIAHDAVLWHASIVAPAGSSTGNKPDTLIIAHGLPALWLLARVAAAASPFVLPALLAAVFGPLLAGEERRTLGVAALCAFLWFLVMPLAYADRHPQLATGASLRYAAPALVLGALLLARIAARWPYAAVAVLLLATAYGASQVMATYWNDGGTHVALAIAAIAAANTALARLKFLRWLLPAGFAAAAIVATVLATRDPVAYYAEGLRVNGRTTGVYAWIARTRPPAVGGWGLRAGIVNVLDPAARAIDLPDATPCLTAQRERVLMLAIAEDDRPGAFNADRLRAARACRGRERYDDGIAVAVSPSG